MFLLVALNEVRYIGFVLTQLFEQDLSTMHFKRYTLQWVYAAMGILLVAKKSDICVYVLACDVAGSSSHI